MMINLPNIIFGTSALGNLYTTIEEHIKHQIVASCINNSKDIPVFDSAGKYGAGLALEVLGRSFKALGVKQDQILISNKLGWYRVPLEGNEPTFEKGVWKDLKYDAIQKISYEGILACFYQGNDLLQGYTPQMVSVHDPDEFLKAAASIKEEEQRFKKILQAYQALAELKAQGQVKYIGVGAKNWRIIEKISQFVKLDWVMIANSLTLHSHPKQLINFINTLTEKGISVVNSAVFNGGFLIGSDYYNYAYVDKESAEGKELHVWREEFFKQCGEQGISPAAACVHFGLQFKGVKSIALNTSKPEHVERNLSLTKEKIGVEFWKRLNEKGLIKIDVSAPF
ncbi:aldo/keto reductase [Olivibacter domesticus]|nr:aldo/keto reductase [Olivibacter domesticus]